MPKRLPHYKVYVRLAPSRIHGIGVFAIQPIMGGTYIFYRDNSELVWVKKRSVMRVPKIIRKLYDDFCISKGELYGCPPSFSELTPAWYLNHSRTPNVAADKNYRFYALRNIAKGEELTVDYTTYIDRPEPHLWK